MGEEGYIVNADLRLMRGCLVVQAALVNFALGYYLLERER